MIESRGLASLGHGFHPRGNESGPSLAVVLRNTISGGRKQGIATGVGHGIGFGIYAFTAALGLATALSVHPGVEVLLKWGGTLILLWLGITFLSHALNGPKDIDGAVEIESSGLLVFSGVLHCHLQSEDTGLDVGLVFPIH